MKKVKEQLSSISRTLAGLSKQVNKIGAEIDRTANGRRSAKRAGRKPGQKEVRIRTNTVLDSVLNAIQRSRRGASIPQLKSKTKLGDRQLSNALYKLTKKGLVHAKARGVYIKS